MFEKIKKFWYFKMANPVVREGDAGGFRWKFRRFDLTIETLSGNFRCKFTAAEHPYAYLIAGKTDENIIGFCQMLYYLGMVITTDQGLVDDIKKAYSKYEKRASKSANVAEDEVEEKIAIEQVKKVTDYAEKTGKERRKTEKEIDKRFKKAQKKAKE